VGVVVEMAVMVAVTITVTLVGSEVEIYVEVEVEKATGAAEAVDARSSARKRIRNNILDAGVGMAEEGANSVAGGNKCDGSSLRTGGVCTLVKRVGDEEEWCDV
jgi:hypothetical protein